eukprot:m.100230 g.100230  ORF g.100230 m.100230 type:complete len:56 (+) comp20655_c0_seq1:153-320(+)
MCAKTVALSFFDVRTWGLTYTSQADSIMNSLRIGIAASPAILSLLALESSTAAGA